MALNLSTISPPAKAGYIRLGRAFSSIDTLAQANKTLMALAIYGAELVRHGFGPSDTEQLGDARDLLVAESVGRGEVQGAKKATGQAHQDALARGREERMSARAILSGAARVLRDTGGEAAEAAARRVAATLKQTVRLPTEGKRLAEQLDLLRITLTDAPVAAAAADRGGPAAVVDLEKTGEALRAADKEHAGDQGARAATERLDLLDGIVVTLARSAARAARAAARRLGTPALAAEFETTAISPRTRPGSAAAAKPEAPATAPATVTAPANAPAMPA